MGWPWLVSGPWARGGVLLRGWGVGDTASPPLTSPALHTGMPTAYDLSSVIAGGSSVGHNNLIPLGECPLGPGGAQGGRPQFSRAWVLCDSLLFLGLPAVAPLRSSLPHSAAAAPTLPTP